MNDEAYVRMERLLAAQELLVGASGLGEASVAALERDLGGRTTPSARQRLIERLKALERHLSVMDGTLVPRSLGLINDVLERSDRKAEADAGRGRRVETAVLLWRPPGEREPVRQNLAALPDLSGPRAALRDLINQILEDADDA